MTHPFSRRDWLIATACALIAAAVLAYVFNPIPVTLDSYYHVNGASRIVSGKGLTDTYLWIYLGLPPTLSEPITLTPSHIYWMPGTSILAAASMAIFGASYAAAQIPMALCLAGAILMAALIGGWFGGERRHAILAAILMVLSSSYADSWGQVDTFAPYALIGSAALVCMICGSETGRWRWWLAAGLLSGLGHLLRADGLLLMGVGVLAALVSGKRSQTAGLAALSGGYLLAMGPWFVRMMQTVGAPLPIGGIQTAYITDYIQIFRYPWQELSISSVGFPALIQVRLAELPTNLASFFVSEGWLLLWPLMLWGLFRVPRAARMVVGLFALGLHAAMIFIFALPAAHGSLFHGASALMPFWAALTVIGGDALARRISRRRPRSWSFTRGAVAAFIVATAAIATYFSAFPIRKTEPPWIPALRPYLTADDRVMTRDPAQSYYYFGTGGVVLPDAPIEVLPEMAETFDLDYLVIEAITTGEDGRAHAIAPDQFDVILAETPPYLELLNDFVHTRLYKFVRRGETP